MRNLQLAFARRALRLGLHRVVGKRFAADVIVLNYHRIRARPDAGSEFDDGVFDVNLETFTRQMQWLKAETTVLDEAGLLNVVSDGYRPSRSILSAVTFDDGYVDCIDLAHPILLELGIRGIFFIPVEMIESRRLGWWDLAANLLKRTDLDSIQLDGCVYDLINDFGGSLRSILQRFKLEPAARTAELLERLAEACGMPLATQEAQSEQLLTWPQIRELHRAGHAIGAHSMTHRVLATLTDAEQEVEIRESRRRLEGVLGCRVRSFAYPVGGPAHINEASSRLVREAGYDLAFTFNTGAVRVPVANRFRIPREPADTLELLEAKALFSSLIWH